MKTRFFGVLAVSLGVVVKIYAQTDEVVLTTNQVKTASAANIGVIYVPTNYLAWIRGDFAMSGSTNYAVSTKSIAVQNSNGVLYASEQTTIAYSTSVGGASWVMGYAISGSTNVLCQGTGVEAETWNGRWQGSVELVPLATEPTLDPPPVISAISVSGTNATDATIIWNTDQPADSTVEWGTTTAYGTITNTVALVMAHSLSLNNLTPSTTYHYRVSSVNATGQGAISADNSFVTPADPPPPPVISAISVSGTNATDATIIWSTDQAADSTVEWGTTTAYGTITNTVALVTAHSLSLSNLTPSTTYHYRVSSTNATGQSAVSADNSFVTGGCPLTNGLAGYWAFENNYNDSSWLGNNLSAVGSPLFNSRGYIYNAMDCNYGTYAQIADNPTLGLGGDVSFTISCWVYSQYGTSLRTILDKSTAFDGVHDTYLIYDAKSVFRFYIGDGTHSASVSASNTGIPQAFTWYHIVGVYDAAAHQINIWVNNVSNTPVPWIYGTKRNAGAFTIGAPSQGTYYKWNGLIDETIIWTNRALTATEIGQVYTNGTRGLTPLNYCSGINARNTVIFNGDAYFGSTASQTNIPNWFKDYSLLGTSSWVSNHNAYVVNYSAGNPPPTPPNVEQVDDLTNNAMKNLVLSYVGPGTNVYWITECGINDIYIMTNGPLYGYWTAETLGYQLTNYFHTLTTNGVKVIPMDVMPFWKLEMYPGDGTLSNAELVRQRVNQILLAGSPNYFGYLNTSTFLSTNGTPQDWNIPANPCELNDMGNTNVVIHLNALMNTIAP